MTVVSEPVGAEPFFLAAEPGQRFCLFFPPLGQCREAVLYVPPFGDEMNKSRRMVAETARALAARGIGVLLLDLHGSGDSSGEFRDARWDGWKADLEAGCAWLNAKLGVPVSLLGLRLGALLALDYAKSARHPIARLVLWQPVPSGSLFLTQFLRLLTANAMLADSSEKPAGEKGNSTAQLRAALLGGETLEVAGYEIASELAQALDCKDAARLAPAGVPVHWFETASPAERPLTPVLERLIAAWRAEGAELTLHRLSCMSFWGTQEISEAPELVRATADVFVEAR
jgi:exosortase A-associated hydrolase 2